jgi:hypothetical protein
MRLLAAAISLLVAFGTVAQAPLPRRSMAQEEKVYRERLEDIAYRAWEVRPRRRDTPLRELNISDNEIREIEALTSRLMRDSMVNISPVVGDCPCEEGPMCTAQVYVVATTAGKTLEVQYSRIRNAWQIGPVQAWWTRKASLEERLKRGEFPDFREYLRAQDELLEEFPMCVGRESAAKTE